VLVDPRDQDHLLVAVSCGGVWESYDNGKSWECISDGMRAEYLPEESAMDPNLQDPHLIRFSEADPDTICCQHHNGIFIRRKGQNKFEEISNSKWSNFGFAVAVHPHDENTAWFVPAVKDLNRIAVNGKICVSKTTDGGRNFQQLSNGLPQNNAFDLVLRHALDVDKRGELLAFGSTTGNFMLSENGGDNWDTIFNNLPPIYSVIIIDED